MIALDKIAQFPQAVEAQGFKKYARTGLEVNVNDSVAVNAALELGAITEQVTVETSPIQVDIQSASKGHVVHWHQQPERLRCDNSALD